MSIQHQEPNPKRVLLVEGPNDLNFILHLCKAQKPPISIPDTFSILVPKAEVDTEDSQGGFEKLLKKLGSFIKESDAGDGPEIIGVVVDADADIARCWAKIQGRVNQVRERRYRFPKSPEIGGTILPDNPGKPRFGIWVMPNNETPGMLEDFLKNLADSRTIAVAEKCVRIAKDEEKVAQFKETHRSKAVVYTYLAWQKKPGTAFGIAVKERSFRRDTEEARAFVDWLRKLFVDSPEVSA